MPSSIDKSPTSPCAATCRSPSSASASSRCRPRTPPRSRTLALQAGYRHIDTAAAYRNEAGVGQALRASGPRARGGVHHHQVLQRQPRLRPGQAGVREQPRAAGARPRGPLPDPLARALPGQVRRDLEGVHRAAGGGAHARDRRVELPARPPEADRRRDRRHAGRQPDRAAPAPAAAGAAPRARRARDRDRGVEPARPGRRCSTTR